MAACLPSAQEHALDGRTALVTGAFSGLGMHFARGAGGARREGGVGGPAHRARANPGGQVRKS
jgi:hypothetical protein